MNNVRLKKILISVVFSVVINILVYNYRLIIEKLFNVEAYYVAHYILRFFAYLIFTIIFRRYFISGKIFLVVFIPVFAIDSLTLLTGIELVPLRFPYDTLYPALGILCGLQTKNLKIFFLSVLFSALFIVGSDLYIRPWITWKRRTKIVAETIPKINLFNKKFLSTAGKTVILSDTINKKTVLIEFYFVGCKPCEEKYEALKTIKKNQEFVEVILICDGEASSYSNFREHAKNNEFKGITFLYDNLKVLENLKWVKGYPTEMIFFGDTLRNVDTGFSASIYDRWLQREEALLNNLKNEN